MVNIIRMRRKGNSFQKGIGIKTTPRRGYFYEYALDAYCVSAFFLAGIYLPRALAQEKLTAYPAVIHIHSTISGADYLPRRVIRLAKDKGIRILIFTDSLLRRWEYGLPGVSTIFRFSAEEDSISSYGIKRYLNDFKKIKTEFPDMLILEGAEVAPFIGGQAAFLRGIFH